MAQSSAKSASNTAAPAAKSSRRVVPAPAPQKVRAVAEPAARNSGRATSLLAASSPGAPGVPGGAASIHQTNASPSADVSALNVSAERAVRRLNGGAPLPPSTRERMESSFGRSFESVRVHTDAAGTDLAQGVGAEAVTIGDAIAFAPAAFRPETESGEHLIAHELAHVAQQAVPAPHALAAAAHLPHSQPSEPAELAAEQAANAVSRGEPARVSPGTLGSASGRWLGGAIGTVSTRSRLMRRARSGGLPALVVSTPTPGEGAIGKRQPGLDPEEQAEAQKAQAAASGQATVRRQQGTPPDLANGDAAASANANDALGELRRKRLDEEQKSHDKLRQGRAALDAATEAQAEQGKKLDQQRAEAATKAREQQAMNQSAEPPAPGSPAAAQAAAVTAKSEATAPTAPPEVVAADAAKDEAEVSASAADAKAQQAATEATPEDPEAAKKKAKAPASPEEDPAFVAVVGQARAAAFQQGHNSAAARKVAEMQEAVADPAGAAEAKAKGAHVTGPMASAEPAPFNRGRFEQAVLDAIAGVEPASEAQAKGFRVPGSVGAAVSAATAEAKSEAAGPVAGAAAATPSTAGVTTQPGGSVPAMPAGPKPTVEAEGATPKPRGEGEVEDPLKAPGKDFDKNLEESGFEEKTFTSSNEPELTGVVSARDDAQKKTASIIEQNRNAETQKIDDSKASATHTSEAGTASMSDTRGQQFAAVVGQQKQGKSKEEQTREELKQKLSEIYDRSKKKVDDKLQEVDTQVNAEFARGLEAATSAYQTFTDGEVGSTLNFLANIFDWTEFKNRVYGEGKRRWQGVMRQTISTISGIVANGLNQAHQLAVDGAQEARTWFEKQPAEKQKLGQEAFTDIQGKFDDLKKAVEAHGQKLVTELADKYKKAAKELDLRIEADKEKNQSIWEKAAALLKEGLAILKKLKEMLLGIASSAAAVIGQILADPGAFLDTLIAGVKGGLSAFIDNIGEHLKKGLMTWLLGQLPPGITLPEQFDLKGIVTLGLQILGLTYANFRARAVAIVGEPIVKALETAADVFIIFLREGPAGLFKFIGDKVTELKAIVLDGIRDMVVSEIVKAGIGFILGLLNPAGALIKIVKTIIDIVQFFITNGSRIVALVQAVIGSLAAIASGDSSGVAKRVESALAAAVPVALGFLASLLGLGGIPAKIQAILDKIRAPINKAIDFVINLAVKLVKAAGKLIAGAFGGKKDDPNKPKQDDPQKAAKVAQAERFINDQEAALGSAEEIDGKNAQKVVAAAQGRRDLFKSVSVAKKGNVWRYSFTVNPPDVMETPAKKGEFPPVEVSFNPHHDWANQFFDEAKTISVRQEYIDQIQRQEAGIRQIKAGDWQSRGDAFKARKLANGRGRDPDSAKAQAQMRDLLREQMRAFLKSRNVNGDQAELAINDWLATRHVLHDPDQVAAGQALVFNGAAVSDWQKKFNAPDPDQRRLAFIELKNAFGFARVNMSIGAQWVTKDRGKEFDGLANAEIPSKVQKIDNAVTTHLADGPEKAEDLLTGVSLFPKE